LSIVFWAGRISLIIMSRANGSANGATKRGANGKPANAQVAMHSNKAGHEKTDYTRWRLKDDRGCQTWHYLETDEEIKAWPQSKADKYFLGLDTVSHHTGAELLASCI
jgi:lanosterol synthase